MPPRQLMLGAATLVAGLTASSAHASLLNLTLDSSPDVTSGFIDVTYDAGTGSLAADGFALSYDDGSSSAAITGGLFSIAATIDAMGNASAGSLSIDGTVGGFGSSLLEGSLVGFGFQDGGGDLFEFTFAVTGGDLSAQYGGIGTIFGVILTANGIAFDGDWTQSFDNTGGFPGFGTGVADIAPLMSTIPLPPGVAMGGLGLAAVAWKRRRR